MPSVFLCTDPCTGNVPLKRRMAARRAGKMELPYLIIECILEEEQYEIR